MKRMVLLLLLLSLFAPGCHVIHDETRGSGNIKKEVRELGSFTSISTEGAFDIEIVCQKPQRVEIEGDDNILSLVSVAVSNNVLRLESTKRYSVSHPIVVRIAVPDLKGVTSAGAGKIEISGLKNEQFEINANGAPNIRASGETKVLKVDVNGAGGIDTHRLRAARVRVDTKGVAKVEVYASDQLDVTVSGLSHVIYSGNAVVNKTVNGPGSVEKKADEVN